MTGRMRERTVVAVSKTLVSFLKQNFWLHRSGPEFGLDHQWHANSQAAKLTLPHPDSSLFLQHLSDLPFLSISCQHAGPAFIFLTPALLLPPASIQLSQCFEAVSCSKATIISPGFFEHPSHLSPCIQLWAARPPQPLSHLPTQLTDIFTSHREASILPPR